MDLPSSSPGPEDELPVPKEKHPAASPMRIGLGVAIGLTLLWVISPSKFIGQRKAADRTEAINHIKEIYLALEEFDSDYGRFPDASTSSRVVAISHTKLTLGDGSSNQLFRQLFAAGLERERLFYARIAGAIRPDDRFDDDAHALSRGECAFAYIPGLSSHSPPETPVLMTPMIPGTTRFDPKPFDGKAVILRIDGSAKAMPIDDSGRIMVEGKDLFDPSNPLWEGKAPDIKWPE
ncbi:MAG: hypothetical protein JWO82_3787 [Akkermansiaceae bacterium]|nr:hypothetical protein [Akkermansiaceae bacterium]